MIPVQLKLPLAKLLEQKYDLEEENRQHLAAAARNRAAVRQAELAVRAHQAVQTRVLEEMEVVLLILPNPSDRGSSLCSLGY